jgi:hypothetical protein
MVVLRILLVQLCRSVKGSVAGKCVSKIKTSTACLVMNAKMLKRSFDALSWEGTACSCEPVMAVKPVGTCGYA